MFRSALFVYFVAAFAAFSEPVALKDGLGQGVLFDHGGNCYVMFPTHVHPKGRSLNLFTAAPQAGGSAIVYFRRAEADIAVGIVSGSARDRCGDRFSRLPRDVSRALTGARTATLERVNPQGGLERLRMRIDDTRWDRASGDPSGLYQYVFASTDVASGETREVYQGTSGAFLYVDDTPVAMVVTAPNATSVRALRIEEITRPLSRWLSSGSFGALAEEVPQSLEADDGLPYQVTEWSGRLADPEVAPSDLASGAAPFRVVPNGQNVSLVLQLSEEKAVRVREIVLEGPTDPGQSAAPRRIAIEVDRSRPGRTAFQRYATADMTPDAPLTVPINTFARQVRISILSTWTPGLPVEISAVRVFAPE